MDRRTFYARVAALRQKIEAASTRETDATMTVLHQIARGMFAARQRSLPPAMTSTLGLDPLDSSWDEVLLDEDALAQTYQALNAPALQEAYRATAKDRRKFTQAELPAVTQLFTPRWVVEFLLHNSLGRLWLKHHPDSHLRSALKWLVDPAELRGSLALSSSPPPRALDIRFLDPACGAMNFGLVAFDLFHAMYKEEIDRRGEPGWDSEPSVAQVDEMPEAIIRNNLHGVDIDPLALKLARLSLSLKSGVPYDAQGWNLHLEDSLLGQSLPVMDAAHTGGCRLFDVVATNPPYVSARNLDSQVVAALKRRFPCAWRDLYACFIQRGLELTAPGGYAALLTMHSFMFTGSYQKLRQEVMRLTSIDVLAHYGPGLFGVGNPGTLQTVAFVGQRRCQASVQEPSDSPLVAFRLVDTPAEKKEPALLDAISEFNRGRLDGDVPIYPLRQSHLQQLPRGSWAYWAGESVIEAVRRLPRLGDLWPPRQGLATTDNFRFVRFAWEVEPTHPDAPLKATADRWRPYVKGGQFRRWYEAPRHRVNWQDDGREIKQAIIDRYPYLNGQWKWVAKNTAYYGRIGVAWSYLTSATFSARRLEEGSIFDVAASSLFPGDVPGMIALLNTSAVARLLHTINPTVNFQVGDLAELPIPARLPGELADFANRAIAAQRQLDMYDETTTDFSAPLPWTNAVEQRCALLKQLREAEQSAERIACEIYALSSSKPMDVDEHPALDETELARRWCSFAVGKLLGRWAGAEPGKILQLLPADGNVLRDLRETLVAYAGDDATRHIESRLRGLDRYLAVDFFAWCVKTYQRRPPYWVFSNGNAAYLLAHDAAEPAVMRHIAQRLGISLPQAWRRTIDDGILPDLASLRHMITNKTLLGVLNKVADDITAAQ